MLERRHSSSNDNCDYKVLININIISSCLQQMSHDVKSWDFYWVKVTGTAGVCCLHSWTKEILYFTWRLVKQTCNFFFLIQDMTPDFHPWKLGGPGSPGENSHLGKNAQVWLSSSFGPAVLSLLRTMASLPQELLLIYSSCQWLQSEVRESACQW